MPGELLTQQKHANDLIKMGKSHEQERKAVWAVSTWCDARLRPEQGNGATACSNARFLPLTCKSETLMTAGAGEAAGHRRS